MNHAGSSPCPEDPCPDSTSSGAGSECCSIQQSHATGKIGFPHRESLYTPELAANLPIQTARADAAMVRDSLPFVVQAGPVLFMVAEESSEWVVAELQFDSATCTFFEARRARFEWPREAFGRLLSRIVNGDDIDYEEVDRVSAAFTRWLAMQFVA
jgi:hypothetical protein